jgi:hypothetical protein
VQVLYLFAGAKRRSGLAASLKKAFRGTGLKVNTTEMDVLRGGARHDLLGKARQKRLLKKISEGEFVLVVSSPPCGTFSRARHANRRGPRPVRSKVFPRGFPWLQGRTKKHVKEANELVDFTVRAFTAQHLTNPGLTLLEHPEDLGKVSGDFPGSIWQLPGIRALGAEEGVVTCAVNQADYGTSYPKPTRLLGRLPGLELQAAQGWPAFSADGRYSGPLVKHQGKATRLIGREGPEFMTAATAAWPTQLCDYLANLVASTCAQGGAGLASKLIPEEAQPTTTLTNGVAGAVVAARVPGRRKITHEEFEILAKGGSIGLDLTYIGRGGRGAKPSRWGNPFRVSSSCTRAEAISKYKTHVNETGLLEYINELTGKDLLCHCGPEEECHGDHLLVLARAAGLKSMVGFLDDGLPVRATPARPAAMGPQPTATAGPERRRQAPASASPQAASTTSGWHGIGPPRKARHMGGDKPFHDGGGLCSPGRWPPGKRGLPAALPGLRARLLGQFEKAVRAASDGADDPLSFMLKLAAGRFKKSPFGEPLLEETRARIRDMLDMPAAEDVVVEGQVFHLPLMAGILRAYGDPDWRFVQDLGEGVSLGVDEELPRTPSVFEEKGKWRLADDVGPGADTTENYQSVSPHVDKVRALFQEEAAMGGWSRFPRPRPARSTRTGSRLQPWVWSKNATRSGWFTMDLTRSTLITGYGSGTRSGARGQARSAPSSRRGWSSAPSRSRSWAT